MRGLVVRVGDAESPPEQLVLSLAVQSRLAAISVGGQGAERWLDIVPRPNANGFETLRLVVRDPNGAVSTRDFILYILPVNDPPEMDPVPDLTLWAGQPEVSVPVGVRDVDNPPASLKYLVESSHPEVRARFAWEDSGARLTVPSLPAHVTGHILLTLKVSDDLSTALRVCRLEIPSPLFTRAGTNPGSVEAVLDLDADGWLDTYLAPADTNNALATGRVRLARAASAEQAEVALPTGAQALTWGDFDGDGLLDALARSYPSGLAGSPVLQLIRPGLSPSNTLQFVATDLPLQFRPGTRISAGPSGDLDGDGDLDVVFTATAVVTNRLLINEGKLGFGVRESGLPAGVSNITLGDLDEDGDLDVLGLEPVTDPTAGLKGPVLYANDGWGHFSLLARGPQLTNAAVVGTVDVDGDGRLEIWVQVWPPTWTSSGLRGVTQALFLYRRSGATLTEIARVDLLSDRFLLYPLPVTWADFNQDGLSDLLTLTSAPGRTADPAPGFPLIYLNQGGGRLSCYDGAGGWAAWPGGLRLWPGDFNGDGRLDFLNSLSNRHDLWHNVSPSAQAPPLLPPENLQVRNFGSLIWFGWEAPADQVGRPAPTYNLRVGTRPGGHDLVPAHALPDGRRLLIAPGNAGSSRQFWVRLPQPFSSGRLYWSVQVVDAAHRGGPFAPEQIVPVDLPQNQPPQMGPIPDVVLNEDETREIEFTIGDDLTSPERLVSGAFTSNLELFPTPLHVQVLGPAPSQPPALRRLFISPRTNQWGEAEVQVVVYDEAGLSTRRTVRVTVLPQADVPETRLTARREGSEVRLYVQVEPYTVWKVEASSNLVDWTPVHHLEPGDQSAQIVAFYLSGDLGFYRLRRIR